VAVPLVFLLAPVLVTAELDDRPPPIVVWIEGEPTAVGHATTLGEVIRTLGLRPEPGRLLAVDGDVIDRRASPGSILVNGTELERSTTLRPDDVLVVLDGEDRVEGTRREIERLPGLQLANPMDSLARSRVLEVTTVGRVSGTVASVRYEAVGRARPPAEVALTFDDGPWQGGTRRVLDVLERLHAPATFFMVGYLIERHPQIVRRVASAGMTIGTHSWSHPTGIPFDELTPHRIETEIERPAALLASLLGARPTLFRAPGGDDDGLVVDLAHRAWMRVVRWSVDPHDYRSDATPGRIVADVLRSVGPGSIVLLHDGGGDRSATIRALPRIIRGIRRMGLELAPIPA
jgi:peptidoglycan/xylan/chitin deacetylase (PgdA/CDA1 family)/sulfur carrier protein ThiS